MIAPLLSMLLTQAAATPAPAPSTTPALSEQWKKLPLGKDQYAHYMRVEPDGTQSEIIGTRQVCDCQPPHLMQMLSSSLASVRGVSTAIDSVSLCGGTQPRFVATGIANSGTGGRNMEVIALRKEPALYMLEYTFSAGKPAADVLSALAALCP